MPGKKRTAGKGDGSYSKGSPKGNAVAPPMAAKGNPKRLGALKAKMKGKNSDRKAY